MVVDASVIVDALGDDGPAGERARSAIRNDTLIAPDFFDLEAMSAWRRNVYLGEMAEHRADLAIHELRMTPIVRVSTEPLIRLIWAARHNLSIYDASYVALATAYDVPLITRDTGIASAPGIACELIVLD